MSSVYIIASEPVSEIELNKLERQLRNCGYSVFSHKSAFDNYHKRFYGTLNAEEKVQLRIKQLLTCNNVATLGGWTDDKTCQLEMNIASATGKQIVKILKG